MISLVIHTIDGRRHVWKDVDEDWLDLLNGEDPNHFIHCSDAEPVIRVGAITTIDVIKEEDK